MVFNTDLNTEIISIHSTTLFEQGFTAKPQGRGVWMILVVLVGRLPRGIAWRSSSSDESHCPNLKKDKNAVQNPKGFHRGAAGARRKCIIRRIPKTFGRFFVRRVSKVRYLYFLAAIPTALKNSTDEYSRAGQNNCQIYSSAEKKCREAIPAGQSKVGIRAMVTANGLI